MIRAGDAPNQETLLMILSTLDRQKNTERLKSLCVLNEMNFLILLPPNFYDGLVSFIQPR
jgi:hypothetical protein